MQKPWLRLFNRWGKSKRIMKIAELFSRVFLQSTTTYIGLETYTFHHEIMPKAGSHHPSAPLDFLALANHLLQSWLLHSAHRFETLELENADADGRC